ncbi:MAG: hypothetical protein KBS81_05130, partial [Spirochaetales bacterium]|nr:hypothetical protein [Candidatus Physcosoma equi]
MMRKPKTILHQSFRTVFASNLPLVHAKQLDRFKSICNAKVSIFCSKRKMQQEPQDSPTRVDWHERHSSLFQGDAKAMKKFMDKDF